MGTARRILSALIGAAAISLLSSCSLGGGETDGVEVRLDPSRVAAAAREAVEGIEANGQVRVKVWAEFLCEYGAEKETREFVLFDRDLSYETFDVEFNEWTEGDLKGHSSFTIDELPVGKTVTFTMSIHFKLSGAIDDEFTPYTSDPAKATIGVDRELTLTLHANYDDEEDCEEDEVVPVGHYTIKAAVPAGLTEPNVTYGSFFIWFQNKDGKWDWIELNDASSQSTISDGFIKYEGFLGKEIGASQKMCVSASLVIKQGTASGSYYSGISSVFPASESGSQFILDLASVANSDVPAPTHAILATLKFPTGATGEECRCTMVFRRNSGDGVPLLTCQSSRTFKAESGSEAEIHIDASELEEIGNTTAGIYVDFYLHTGATKDDGLKYKLGNRNIPFGLNRISKPGNIVLEKVE